MINLINLKNQIKNIILKIYYLLIFKRRIFNQLNENKNFQPKANPKKKKIFIPLVETAHPQIYHLLILAKSLVLRGHEVKVLICDGYLRGCEIKSYINKEIKNPCWVCKNNIVNILPLFGLDYILYSDYIKSKEKKKIIGLEKKFTLNLNNKIKYKYFDLTRVVNESLIRYYYGNKFFGNFKKIRSDHINTSLISIIFAEKILQNWNPDIILNNMPVYSAWEPFFAYFKKKKKRLVTISLTPLNKHAIFFNLFELLLSDKRFNDYLKKRKNKKLNEDERKKLKKFIKNRVEATDDHIKKNRIIENNNKETQNIFKFLKNNNHKKNIFMFTNVYWDIGLLSQAGIYDDVVTWTLDTIKQLGNNDNINLFIKTHPGEINKTSGSLTTLEQIIKNKIKKIPNNVFFIKPELRVNVYSLVKYIDLSVIFTGTLGLEMMLLNVPVINVGKVPYDSLKLSINPKDKKDYYNELKKRKNINSSFRKDFLDLYSYFYFIKTTIPWNLTEYAYGHRFTGFNFESVKSLHPNNNKSLDHICECIISDKKSPEFW